jgi:hypothetical protein
MSDYDRMRMTVVRMIRDNPERFHYEPGEPRTDYLTYESHRFKLEFDPSVGCVYISVGDHMYRCFPRKLGYSL